MPYTGVDGVDWVLSVRYREQKDFAHLLVSFQFRFVPLHVERQVIRSRETPVADDTSEGFGARVFPDVTCQFIGTRKPPLARGERA